MQVCSCSLLLTQGCPLVVLWCQLMQPACSQLQCAFWDVHMTILLSSQVAQVVHRSSKQSTATLWQNPVIPLSAPSWQEMMLLCFMQPGRADCALPLQEPSWCWAGIWSWCRS